MERFISFDFPLFIFRVFGCGNKLLPWPKTNRVVDVWFAGTICYSLAYIFKHKLIIKHKIIKLSLKNDTV